MAIQPIQEGFSAGEIAEDLRGQFSAPFYKRGLSFCEDFMPKPGGALLMRGGSKRKAEQAGIVRTIPFNVSGGDPYVLALLDQKLRIFARNGVPQMLLPPGTDKITNGRFDAGTSNWTVTNGTDWFAAGYIHVEGVDVFTVGSAVQRVALANGQPYALRFRARRIANENVRVIVRTFGGAAVLDVLVAITTLWADYQVNFVGTPALVDAQVEFITPITGVATYLSFDLDEVSLIDTSVALVEEAAAPWTAGQIAAVQYDQDLTRNRMMLVHGNVPSRLALRDAAGVWRLETALFVGAPAVWAGTNYPSVIDWGFQGRLWLGATPSEPNLIWYSKSGEPFNFTTGVNPNDSSSFNASIRGGLRWVQGQKSLLMGAERVEQAAHGSGSIIAPGNIQVEDESAFGSAAIQAAHLGDEVIFVGRDRAEIRALSYDAQTKGGWISLPVSFLGSHLVHDLKEIHFARRPVPTILGLRTDGTLIACTYDKALQVVAWWRISKAGILSAAILDTVDGDEIHFATANGIEAIPLHEAGAKYLDSHVVSTVPAGGLVTGLAHLNGQSVKVVIGGALAGEYLVAGGVVQVDPATEGSEVVVGVPFTAKAITLPLNLKSMAAHNSKLGAILNRSAIPRLNGRLAADRKPGTAMDTPEALRSGKIKVGNLGTDDEAKIEITQDLPFRTEILALFSTTEV